MDFFVIIFIRKSFCFYWARGLLQDWLYLLTANEIDWT